MSQAVAEKKKNVCYFSNGLFAGVPAPKKQWFTKNDDEKTVGLFITGLPIFRSGTFADSMGFVQTWEPEHIHQMVMNYGILTSRGIFSDVPVRKGHPSPFTNSMDEVIGYIHSLSTGVFESPIDGEKHTYLLADFDVIEEQAAKRIDEGLWRNRSSEIGYYVTNNESEFYPVLTGFAWVDIPAVEGLNFSMLPGVNDKYSVIVDQTKEEAPVANENTGAQGTSNHGAPAVPGTPAVPSIPAATVQPLSFSYGAGLTTQDYSVVQAYMKGLEDENAELKLFQTETQRANRKAFITGLATTNKILASQVEGLTEFALSLSDDQWNKYAASYEAAPSLPLLGEHAATAQQGGTQAPTAQELAIAEAQRVYARLKVSGMTDEQLKQTGPYKTLQAAGLTAA